MLNNDTYFTCGVCGRQYHKSMGDVGVCCFCKKKMSNGLWPTKIIKNRRDRWYVLWAVKRDVIAQFDNHEYDLCDIEYIDAKRAVYQIPVAKEGCDALKSLTDIGGYIRSIRPVDKKPVFHWGYHRLMWELLAKYDGRIGRYDAWNILTRLFPQIESIIYNTAHIGFACPAAVGRDGEITCKRCPLQWGGVASNYGPPCCYERSPYIEWVYQDRKMVSAKRAAHATAYLPLTKDAEKKCTIDD